MRLAGCVPGLAFFAWPRLHVSLCQWMYKKHCIFIFSFQLLYRKIRLGRKTRWRALFQRFLAYYFAFLTENHTIKVVSNIGQHFFLLRTDSNADENIKMKKLTVVQMLLVAKLHCWKILHENLIKHFFTNIELITNKPCIFALQFAAIVHVDLIESISVTLSQSTRAKFSFYKLNAPNWTNMLNPSFKSNEQEAKISVAGTKYT